MSILKRILYFIVLSFVLFSCNRNSNEEAVLTVKFSKRIDSILLSAAAEDPKIDSLKALMDESASDTSKISLLLKISRKLDYKSATVVYSEIQTQAKAIKFDHAFYKASLAKEFFFANTAQFDSAQHYHEFISEWAVRSKKVDVIISDLLNYSVAFAMQKKLRPSDSILFKTIELVHEYKDEDKNHLAFAYYYLGKNKNIEFDNENALKYLNEAVKYSVAAKNDDLTGDIYFRIGECYLMESDYNNSLTAYGNSVAYCEKNKDEKTMASALAAIGEIYVNKDDFKKAYENLYRSLEISKKIKYAYQEAYTLSSLASALQIDSNYAEALKYFNESNSLYSSFNKENHTSEILLNNLNIGTVYTAMGDHEKALSHLSVVYAQMNAEAEPAIAAETLNSLSDLYYLMGDLFKAETLAERALVISKQNELVSAVQHSYEILYKIFERKKNFEKAHYYYKTFSKLTDSLTNKTQIKKFAELENDIRQKQLKAEHDIKESGLRNEKLQKEEELKRHRITSMVTTIGFIVLLIFAVLIFRSLQENKKKTKIISEQKKEVEQQKEIIEEKKKEVLDSIEYAKKIQEAILPSDENIRKVFPGSFVFYKPKDIVAGDFYWLEKRKDKILIAVGDCTGHGVPGAMVSVVCSNALNRAVKEFGLIDPGMILDKAREIIVETFEKSGSEMKDGMDISLLVVPAVHEEDSVSLEWAGANNPLWYISDNKFFEIKANKQPVGKYIDHKAFTTQKLNLKRGDLLYLISDGFADQFGGPKGKKFKYKALNELLIQNSDKQLEAQKEILKTTFDLWKGNLEQVDDVCILGIRL